MIGILIIGFCLESFLALPSVSSVNKLLDYLSQMGFLKELATSIFVNL
jgi:hypothetical protein